MTDRLAKFAAAQALTHYEIDGKLFARVRYGDETEDWGANRGPCHDCGVVKGQFHVGPGCDVERCPCCGGQAIYCDCDYTGARHRPNYSIKGNGSALRPRPLISGVRPHTLSLRQKAGFWGHK